MRARRTGIAGGVLPQQLEIADHRHQQIVEVVRDAAGELADHLHLLHLAQLLLRAFPMRHFGQDRLVRASSAPVLLGDTLLRASR